MKVLVYKVSFGIISNTGYKLRDNFNYKHEFSSAIVVGHIPLMTVSSKIRSYNKYLIIN